MWMILRVAGRPWPRSFTWRLKTSQWTEEPTSWRSFIYSCSSQWKHEFLVGREILREIFSQTNRAIYLLIQLQIYGMKGSPRLKSLDDEIMSIVSTKCIIYQKTWRGLLCVTKSSRKALPHAKERMYNPYCLISYQNTRTQRARQQGQLTCL